MRVLKTRFHGLKLIKGTNFYDKRGYFRELLKNNFFKKQKFIFWSISKSKKNVLRGLHLQTKFKQAKFVSVIKGKIYDVVVDLRKGSKTYGKYYGVTLTDNNSTSLFVPVGFAHGFCSLDNESLVLYGMTNYRSKKNEVGILWNDRILKIKWPIKKPLVSKRDKNNIILKKFNKLYSNKF